MSIFEPGDTHGSHDGTTAADHDDPWGFGRHGERLMRPLDLARLLIMRSRIQDTREGFGHEYAGDLAQGPSLEEFLADAA